MTSSQPSPHVPRFMWSSSPARLRKHACDKVHWRSEIEASRPRGESAAAQRGGNWVTKGRTGGDPLQRSVEVIGSPATPRWRLHEIMLPLTSNLALISECSRGLIQNSTLPFGFATNWSSNSVYPPSLAARKNACKVEWWLSVNASGNAIPPIFQEITPSRAAAFRPVVMPFGLLLIGPCLFPCGEQKLSQIRESP